MRAGEQRRSLWNALQRGRVGDAGAHGVGGNALGCRLKRKLADVGLQRRGDAGLPAGSRHRLRRVRRGLTEVIDDPKIQIERILDSSTPPSPVNTELMGVIQDVVREHVEDVVVLPGFSGGFTDSRVFRRRGTTAYGFIPILVEPAEGATMRGHNERISIEDMTLGCQILFEVVRRISA